MSKNIPARNTVYDGDDNAIVRYPAIARDLTIGALAKDIANKRGEVVFFYGDNGRECVQPLPALGMGCTVSYMEDRHAATVIAVSPSGSKVTVREDKAIRTDDNGMSQSQSYTFERNPTGHTHIFHRQGDGTYATRGKRLALGVRSSYHCFER